jgi:hypothetical protein
MLCWRLRGEPSWVSNTRLKLCSTNCAAALAWPPLPRLTVGSRDDDQPDPQRHSKAWTIACAQTNAAVAEAKAVLQINETDHLFVASFRGERIELDLRSGRRSVLTCTLSVVPKNHAWRLVGGYTTRATRKTAKVEVHSVYQDDIAELLTLLFRRVST